MTVDETIDNIKKIQKMNKIVKEIEFFKNLWFPIQSLVLKKTGKKKFVLKEDIEFDFFKISKDGRLFLNAPRSTDLKELESIGLNHFVLFVGKLLIKIGDDVHYNFAKEYETFKKNVRVFTSLIEYEKEIKKIKCDYTETYGAFLNDFDSTQIELFKNDSLKVFFDLK